MRKLIEIISLVIIILLTLVSCKSTTIGEHNNLLSDDLVEMDISPVDNPSSTKKHIQFGSEEIFDFILKIQPEEIIIPEENTETFENPDYFIILHFENSDYNLVIGENYIVVTLNDTMLSVDDILDNTSVYLITEETRIELYEKIDKVLDSIE